MSLIQFLRILAARRAIILATLLACFLTATAAVLLLPPRYEAKNRVLIDITEPDPLTGQVLAPNAVGNYVAMQSKLIKDVQTAGPVIDRLGWAEDPNIQANFEAQGRPGGDIREWLAQQIVDSTEVRFADANNIIEISYRGTDPGSTQRIAEAIREAFLAQHIAARQQNALRGSSAINQQAQNILAQLKKLEEERTQYAKVNGIVLQPGQGSLENSKLVALTAQSAVPALPGVTVPPSPARLQLETVKQQIAQAQQTLGPNHPTLQALRRQQQVLEAQAESGGGTIAGSSRGEIEAAYEAQKARVLAQSDKIDRLNQMQQDINVLREQYAKLVGRAEDLGGQARVAVSDIEPMGNTLLPSKPVWPNKPLVIGGSVAIGLVLGVLLGLLVELLARRVRSDEDLEYAAGAPVLAIIAPRHREDSVSAKLINMIDRKGAERRRELAEA